MNSRRRSVWGWRIVIAILMAAIGLVVWGLAFRQPATQVQASVIGMPTTPAQGSFAQVEKSQKLTFPQAFGPQPVYQTEWWYYTGNLETKDGRHFGFQLTFFRRGIEPPVDQAPRASDWATDQVYLAHFTLTDVTAQKFHYFEQFERGAAGLAGATITPAFQVWLHDWSVEQIDPKTYHLKAEAQGVSIDLTLVDRKGPVLQGNQGYSQKGPQPGNASLYFSQTHLESQGTVTVSGQAYPVSGLSWMDREISTSALSKGEVGWDWFALQLNDGSELMAYVLRRSDGSISEFSSGTLVAPDGETRHLARKDFQITAESTWKSPHSGGVYPSRWKVRVPSANLELEVQPLLADQELNVSFVYWEGAVRLSGTRDGKPVAGFGYVELTGYAKSMEGTL
jgi:predicted secreted hydrolase